MCWWCQVVEAVANTSNMGGGRRLVQDFVAKGGGMWVFVQVL